jgi:hypothetical protein
LQAKENYGVTADFDISMVAQATSPSGRQNFANASPLMFYGGLKSDIQKACTMAGRASPFYALVDQAITFDQLSYEHSKRESGNSSESSGKKQRRQDEVSTKGSSSLSNPKSQPSCSCSYGSLSRLGRPLTPAERDHRTKHNLCMYCSKPGHTIQDCSNCSQASHFFYRFSLYLAFWFYVCFDLPSSD